MKSWSWQQDQAGTYTGGEFTYTSPATEKEIKVTVGKGSRILKQSGWQSRAGGPALPCFDTMVFGMEKSI